MSLYEENEFVIYTGDSSMQIDERRNRSLAIIYKIDESKFPHVGLKLIPSGEKIGVEVRLLRKIQTNEDFLLKMGFQKSVVNNVAYYQLSTLIICAFALFPTRTYFYDAGFRQVQSIPAVIDSSKLMKDGEVLIDVLNTEFPDMQNLNDIVKFLENTGFSNLSIPEIVDIKPFI